MSHRDTQWHWPEHKHSEWGCQSLTLTLWPHTLLPAALWGAEAQHEYLRREGKWRKGEKENRFRRFMGTTFIHTSRSILSLPLTWITVQLIDRSSGISKVKGAACGGRSSSTAVTNRPEFVRPASLHTEPLRGKSWGGKSLVSFSVMATLAVVDTPPASTQMNTNTQQCHFKLQQLIQYLCRPKVLVFSQNSS